MEQILIGAAGNTFGGLPGQLAGFGIVKLLKGTTTSSKQEEGGHYESAMLAYLVENEKFLSLEEREELHQMRSRYVLRVCFILSSYS